MLDNTAFWCMHQHFMHNWNPKDSAASSVVQGSLPGSYPAESCILASNKAAAKSDHWSHDIKGRLGRSCILHVLQQSCISGTGIYSTTSASPG